MKVSNDILARLRAVRELRRGGVDYKAQKTELYKTIHRTHNIPTSVKLSVELDGVAAGEIRVKGTGRAYVPPTAAAAPAASVAGDRPAFVVTDRDGTQHPPVYGLDGLLAFLRDEYDMQVAQVA